MGINRDLIEQRLALMTDYLGKLEHLAAENPRQFVEDYHAAASESYLRRALEALFDIGRHLLAKSGFTDLAAEYKGISRGLVQIGAVSEALGERLVQMAGYRNRLVHLYDRISDDELHLIVTSRLGDLREFIRAIRDYIRSLG